MKHPILTATLDHGQSVWLDFISRKILDNGELAGWVEEGLRGLTSNPTIFQQAISGGEEYDRDIKLGVEHEWSAAETFEYLAVQDITRAADLLRPVYDASNGTDGFVSLEVSPTLAHDTAGTIQEAQRLWKKVSRPNLMVKVPATEAGLPAIQQLLTAGLNINVTLIFSLTQYEKVLEAYVRAIEARVQNKLDVSRIASVASFFVSRVDGIADKLLKEKNRSDLAGKAAIANACIAYRHFTACRNSVRWKTLSAAGAQVQRPLWASTSTKNPDYPDTLYVTELVARDTVNTMPPATLAAWKDHGKPGAGLDRNLRSADETLVGIRKAGVDLDQVTFELIEDGVKKFADSFVQLLDAIVQKSKAVNSLRAKV